MSSASDLNGPESLRVWEEYEIGPPLAQPERVAKKMGLIADIGRACSIRDFGGLWRVHGAYLVEGARVLRADYAQMVDLVPDQEFEARVAQLQAERPVVVEMRQADFRCPAAYNELRAVDVSLLYDVLLHQDPAVAVIRNVAGATRRHTFVAQPALKETTLGLPCGCVNLLFYPRELKEEIRCAEWWPIPEEPAHHRFDPQWWIWGQTVSYLTAVFFGYGWRREHLEVHDFSPHWAYALMRFSPAPRSPRLDLPHDVTPDCRALPEIRACAEAGLLLTYDDGTYRPAEPVKRYELAVVIARALAGGEDRVPGCSGTPSFRDVSSYHWAFKHVEYVHARGLDPGFPGGEFRPYAYLDRAQLAACLARAMRAVSNGAEATSSAPPPPTFSDVPADFWAHKDIEYVARRGAVEGYGDGSYRPDEVVTREQLAVCLSRAFGLQD